MKTSQKENKQFDPGGKGGAHRFEKRIRWYSFFWGIYELGCPARFLALVCLFVLFLFFYCRNIR